MPRVSIVIPTRNAGVALGRALEAIAAQDLSEPYEVVVIDSGSTDGTRELASRHGARVMAIDPADYGHGRTRNAAIAACHGELVVLTVQDAVPADERWLSFLVRALDDHPNAAGAYSRRLPREGAGFVEHYLSQRGTVPASADASREQRWPSEEELARLTVDDLRWRFGFDDTSSIVRRAVWERCPLPDVAYAEDLAWSTEVMRMGYSIVYAPASRVYHSHRRSCWYELRRAYVDRSALLALHADIVPAWGPGGEPAVSSPTRVVGLVRDMTHAARAEGALTPGVWWAIRARAFAGAVGVGLAHLAARRNGNVWPPLLGRWLARGV